MSKKWGTCHLVASQTCGAFVCERPEVLERLAPGVRTDLAIWIGGSDPVGQPNAVLLDIYHGMTGRDPTMRDGWRG